MSEPVIVECVPNFSEGKDRGVIDRIAAALGSVEGATVLDIDPGQATHRTVVTLVGHPEAVLEAAFRGIKASQELIDMSRHQGEHPRIGATDVCPFVPVSGITMEQCAELARRLGERVGRELKIPVYLYEAAAASPARRNLADIRAGEYEGLAKKILQPEWKPDFGPAQFDAKSGATVIGARKFLIAYNVNLNTRAKKLAQEIALEIREQGRPVKGPDGKPVKDAQGASVMKPGRLKNVKAVGWFIEEYGRAQVSINLTDYEVSGLHQVFDTCDEEARKLGLRVTGSELVGLVPKSALLAAGRHYLQRQAACTGVSEDRLIETAIQSLGLGDLAAFDPKTRIIENRLKPKGRSLSELSLKAFVDELGSDSPAPGGGSVAALVASLSAALTSMVGNLTVGRKGSEAHFAAADVLANSAQALKTRMLRAIDEDTEAFDRFMEASRLPKSTPAEIEHRTRVLDAATRQAIQVPLGVVTQCVSAAKLAQDMLPIGNPNAASDAATAGSCALAAAEGALYNVLTNLKGYSGDSAFADDARNRAESAFRDVAKITAEVAAAFRRMMAPAPK